MMWNRSWIGANSISSSMRSCKGRKPRRSKTGRQLGPEPLADYDSDMAIVDCHTHIWQSPEQLGQVDLGEQSHPTSKGTARVHPRQRNLPAADPDYHWSHSAAVDKSIVLGFKSRYLHAEIPNRLVADYVSRDPNKLIGFAGIDPTESAAIEELKIAKNDLRLRGITISPAIQDFHP